MGQKIIPKISIVIPVLNEAATIANCLERILQQKCAWSFDITVIDSGSTDGTVERIKQYADVRLIEIPGGEFGHGRTRNLGARETRGRYIVFLNGDAVPRDQFWLQSLLDEVEGKDGVGGVFSRHVPREDCRLFMQRDLSSSMPGQRRELHDRTALNMLLFSTVSCLIPRSVWEEIPFQEDISIAEDQEWAQRILEEGLTIVYQPGSAVRHSHNYRPLELFHIKRDVSRSLPLFRKRWTAVMGGWFLITGGFFMKLLGDLPFIIRHARSCRHAWREWWVAVAGRASSFFGRYIGWIEATRE